MKKLLLLLLIPFLSFGQGWQQLFGVPENNESGLSVQQTNDGGYIICGTTTPHDDAFNSDVYLIKTNENGEEIWSQTFGGDQSDSGNSVQQTNDGGYIITGETRSFETYGFSDVYLIKTNENGEEMWSQTFGGEGFDKGNSVQQTLDGGYIVCGLFSPLMGGPDRSLYLIKTDIYGNEEWSQILGESPGIGQQHIYEGLSVQQTNDGGYIITGRFTNDNGWNYDLFLTKINSNGEEEWFKLFGGEETFEKGKSVHQTLDGGYIVCGYKYVTAGFTDSDVYLIKTDANGEEEWSQLLGEAENSEFGYDLQKNQDGGYVITGMTESNDIYGYDVYLIKTNENGEEMWSQTFGGEGYDQGNSVQQTTDGGYIVTGNTHLDNNNENQDIYLIKTDSEGNVTSTNIIEATTINKQLITIIDILGRETNNNEGFQLHIYDDGSVEVKYLIK